MFNNALTKVISHYCIFTKALPSLIHCGFQLLSSLPQLRFSSHHGEFAAITFGKDEVLPPANGPIVSSGTVHADHFLLSVWTNEPEPGLNYHTAILTSDSHFKMEKI